MTYKEARVYLDELSKYGSVLGLDTIRGLLRELGNPQDDLRFIHIAGTNGKGSVLAYTSTILSEAGYRVGRYVSPTVISYLERIQVDGVWISEQRFADITAQVRDAIARLEEADEPLPTVFEAETAIAFLYFKEMNCRMVVLEAGLGGALDATNIIKNTMCAVFSSISRDHIGIIGDTTEEIAQNKAGWLSRCGISFTGMPAITVMCSLRTGSWNRLIRNVPLRQVLSNMRIWKATVICTVSGNISRRMSWGRQDICALCQRIRSKGWQTCIQRDTVLVSSIRGRICQRNP